MRRRELLAAAGIGTWTLTEAHAQSQRSRQEAPHSFLAVAIEWPQGMPEATFRVRVSRDGNEWSEWREAARDPHVPEANRAFLAFGDRGQRYLEVEGAPAGLRFHFIDPGETRTPILKQAPPREATARPPIVGRLEWGSPDGNNQRGTPSYTTVTHLIVHHTADGPVADFAAWLRSIW